MHMIWWTYEQLKEKNEIKIKSSSSPMYILHGIHTVLYLTSFLSYLDLETYFHLLDSFVDSLMKLLLFPTPFNVYASIWIV